MGNADSNHKGTLLQAGPPVATEAFLPPDLDPALWRQFLEAATPEAFYRGWLAIQARLLRGVVGGVVVLGPPETGPFAPAATWPEGWSVPPVLAETAERALRERRREVIPETPAQPENGSIPNHFLVAHPVHVTGRLHGVVAFEVLARAEREMPGLLRHLQWGIAWLEVLWLRREGKLSATTKERLQTVLDLTAISLSHEGFFEAATAFVTAAATSLKCDRVSLGFLRGEKIRVRAVSHSADFVAQTNLIRAITAAMEEAVDQRSAVVYPAAPDDRPQVTRAHGDLARQHGAGAICSVPLSAGTEVVGALTLERPSEMPFDGPAVEVCEALAALAGPVLEIERREDRWLITKNAVWLRDLVGKIVGPRHILLKLSLVAAAAFIFFLSRATGEYRVSGTATLEPVVRRAVVAPFAGYVAEAPVRAGDLVHRDQVLATLDDNDLRLQRMKWASQLDQFAKQHQQAEAQHNAAQTVILAAQMEQARVETALLDDELARSRVRSAIDGIVVTGDLSQSLRAPVERGQVLFEVAPLDAFRVVLQVDERNIADVQVGRTGTLVLSGFPGQELPFQVTKITPVSTPKEGHNYFRVEAQLTRTPDRLRPGMEGVGKVAVDRRPLVWIWSHDIVDWVRLTLWKWLP
ncbi:MAG TPA: HlyD family efflux transporter periplasmic adaptor subunit [Candidatus Methylomirabilis sp.]|nr:HlyD family efflux transporter periplasmic adaptor subunit [Candidatus Methylomirabilis sp.]